MACVFNSCLLIFTESSRTTKPTCKSAKKCRCIDVCMSTMHRKSVVWNFNDDQPILQEGLPLGCMTTVMRQQLSCLSSFNHILRYYFFSYYVSRAPTIKIRLCISANTSQRELWSLHVPCDCEIKCMEHISQDRLLWGTANIFCAHSRNKLRLLNLTYLHQHSCATHEGNVAPTQDVHDDLWDLWSFQLRSQIHLLIFRTARYVPKLKGCS